MKRHGITLVLLALAVSVTARAETTFVKPYSPPVDKYPLDVYRRVVPESGKLRCDEDGLVRYKGTHVRYQRPVRVARELVERLQKFEVVVDETAREFYGRAPRRLRHIGTFACRRIRSYPQFLSEHALGNAIDVEGFEFGPLDRRQRGSIPRALHRPFAVTVERHWRGGAVEGEDPSSVHARFLHKLAERLIQRDDIFRILLGPGYPGHKNHFHFDVGPYRMVEI